MSQLTILIEHYGLIVVFLAVLISRLGAPIPAFPTLITAAALRASGGGNLADLILAGIAGGVIADFTWFFASRLYGRKLLRLVCKVSFSPDSCVRQTETVYARIGSLSLVFSKSLPGIGLMSIALAAISGMSLVEFAVLDFAGESLFVCTTVLLGTLFKSTIFAIIATLARLGIIGLALVLGALAMYVLGRWWRRRAFIRQLRMDRISAHELGNMIDRGEKPVIIDVRPHDVRLHEGIIPGALFAHPADEKLSFTAFPPDIEIIVYCACPNEASAAIAAKHLRRAGFRKIRPLLGGVEAWVAAGRHVTQA